MNVSLLALVSALPGCGVGVVIVGGFAVFDLASENPHPKARWVIGAVVLGIAIEIVSDNLISQFEVASQRHIGSWLQLVMLAAGLQIGIKLAQRCLLFLTPQ